MSSEYAQAELHTRKRVQSRLFQTQDDHPIEAAKPLEPALQEEETIPEPGRFQPGVLKPGSEPDVRRFRLMGKKVVLVFRAGQLGIFDWALLLAEVACALVVAWLVAQYIYTVYFDTAPHRVTGSNAVPALSGADGATGMVGTTMAMATRTAIATASHDQRGVGEGNTEIWDVRKWSLAQGGLNRSTANGFMPEPTATPAIETELLLPNRLRIPTMFLDSPVHEVKVNMGVWEVSSSQIGHHEGTANPGETGNLVLAGHRDINSALFRELDRLQPGDEVFVSNSMGEYRYVVTDSFVVNPDHNEVMDPTNDKLVTLITCTPIGLATQRLIVTAVLDEK